MCLRFRFLQVETGSGLARSQIPTYEIITSCQPRVVYSNGYYITSFAPPSSGVPPAAEGNDAATAAAPCYTLSTIAAPTAVVSSTSSPTLLYSTQTAAGGGGTPCFSCSCSSSGVPAQWTITKSTMLSTTTGAVEQAIHSS
jgi:hypothetical protein